jgi:MOSC domain-containing protein YiiM
VIRSVNIGVARHYAWAGLGTSGIDKRPVPGRIGVHALGMDGDTVFDTRHHGGPDQAVYAFSRTELDWWERELGRPIPDGQFGENLTIAGLDVDAAIVGERWAVGDAVLEVATVRIPCNDFKGWQAASGDDATAWAKRFTRRQRSGVYLRVLQEGTVAAGDAVRLLHRPDHGLTASTMFRALTTEPALLPELLRIERLAARARKRVERLHAHSSAG